MRFVPRLRRRCRAGRGTTSRPAPGPPADAEPTAAEVLSAFSEGGLGATSAATAGEADGLGGPQDGGVGAPSRGPGQVGGP